VPAVPSTPDPDAALRMAIKAAIDAGNLARAGKLLDVLKGAEVVELATRRVARTDYSKP
jgi:hypothetical protein